MASGRKRKPTQDKVIQGTFRKDRANLSEPEYDIAQVVPPDLIKENDFALEEWIRITPSLISRKVLTIVDVGTVERYCMMYARWREAEDELKTTGLTIKTSNENIIQNPLVGIANKAAEQCNKFASELGITPATRSKVSSEVGNKEKDDWEEFGT